MRKCLLGAGICAIFLSPVLANAQWSSTIMHPDGYFSSSIHGVSGNQRYGQATPTNETNAGIFTGINTFTSLHPGSAVRSGAGPNTGGFQYGTADTDGTRAARWDDNSASYQDWTPLGAVQSAFFTAWNGFGGGWAQFDGGIHQALLWNTGPNDYVNLSPIGAIDSAVCAIDGSGQYGDVTFGDDVARAAWWTGSAGSYVDLSPAGAEHSQIIGARDGLRVGQAIYGGNRHATVWADNNTTILDLHPAGASDSILMDTVETFQAGWTTWGGIDKASFWNSSAGSYQDLHGSLTGYVKSHAYAMQIWDGEIQIFGTAWTGNGDEHHAIMWSQPVPEPASLVCIGLGITGILARRKRKGK
jgi:hypothetical protein